MTSWDRGSVWRSTWTRLAVALTALAVGGGAAWVVQQTTQSAIADATYVTDTEFNAWQAEHQRWGFEQIAQMTAGIHALSQSLTEMRGEINTELRGLRERVDALLRRDPP